MKSMLHLYFQLESVRQSPRDFLHSKLQKITSHRVPFLKSYAWRCGNFRRTGGNLPLASWCHWMVPFQRLGRLACLGHVSSQKMCVQSFLWTETWCVKWRTWVIRTALDKNKSKRGHLHSVQVTHSQHFCDIVPGISTMRRGMNGREHSLWLGWIVTAEALPCNIKPTYQAACLKGKFCVFPQMVSKGFFPNGVLLKALESTTLHGLRAIWCWCALVLMGQYAFTMLSRR